MNPFEAPTLSSVACLSAIAAQQSGPWLVALAWLYAAGRCAHTFAHIGANVLDHRVAA